MTDLQPPDPHAFYEAVWQLVRQIPHGRIATYGQIAQYISPPAGVDTEAYRVYGARWVGSALAASPEGVP